MKRRRRRLGLRTEVLLLLPPALLVLVGLSASTLFSYRSAIQLLTEERRQEAARLAARVADSVRAGGVPGPEELRRLTPGARGAAVLAPGGRVLAATGSLTGQDLVAPLAGEIPAAPEGRGPGGSLPESVAGFAPLALQDRQLLVRVDLAAGRLAAERRTLEILTALVLGIDAAITVLVLLFLRQLLTPYETLLARARRARAGNGETGAEEDELTFLVRTFEDALEALGESSRAAPEDDLSALQRTLSASLESGVCILDRQGRVLALNRVGRELLGVAPGPAQEAAETLLAAHPELVAALREALESGRPVHRREIALASGGTADTLGLTVHSLRRQDQSVRGHLVLFADLTEVQRRAQEERLSEGISQLGEMAAGVAHELRNSVATLRGYLSLLEGERDEARRREYQDEIRQESRRLQQVVDDFLAFARPGRGRPRDLDLGEVAERVAADPALAPAPVRLRRPEGGLPRIRGDRELLERALRNLLQNAVAANRESGARTPVEVVLGLRDDHLVVEILDRGPGLPEELRDRLFQPFVTGRAGGTGLGLALTQRIVTMHGGRVRLEDRPGGGVRATVRFDAAKLVS